MMPSQQQHNDGIEDIIKDTILSEMISASEAANMPKSFIENIKLRKISDGKYEIENAWKNEDDKPLAVFFEYGTRDHYISGNPILAWPSGGPNSGNPRAIYSKSAGNKKGNILFSYGHYVTGLPALEPMTNGFRRGAQKMKEVLSRG